MAKISDNALINSIRLKEQASAPGTPASGYGQLYCKSDGLYFKGDNGTEIGPLGEAGGGASISTESAALSSDVNITNANTYYDGPSLELDEGTWLVFGTVSLGTPPADFTAKLWDGTTVFASAMSARGVNGFAVSISLAAIVSPTTTTIYKISAACDDPGGKILAAVTHNAAGNNASYMLAIKIG